MVTVHELITAEKVENHLFLFQPGTGEFQRLTLPNGDAGVARLAPDDARIVFELIPERRQEIQLWIEDLNTGQTTRVTDGAIDASPSWRRDGQEILFLRLRFTPAGLETTLMSAAASGGEPSVVFGSEERIAAVAYARDADSFAVWSRLGVELVQRADLTRRVVLPASRILGFVVVGQSLAWSNAEGKIAFSLFDPKLGQYQLWIVAIDGTGLKPIHTSQTGRIMVSAFVED